jgi:phage-related protein (TIGR01555 family)
MWPFPQKASLPASVRSEPVLAAALKRAPMKFRPEVAAALAHPIERVTAEQVFRIPEPMPGVVPRNRRIMAQDDAFQAGGSWATQGIAVYGGFGGLEAFRGYPYLSELAQRPEYRRGVEIISKEMTRKWIRLHSKSGDKSKAKYIGNLNEALEKFRVQEVFREAIAHDGFFGKGQIYIDTGAGDDRPELKTPLIIKPEKIQKGGLKAIKAIEPLWTYPGMYNASDPLHRHFYNPETWYVQGKEIHKSRLLPLVSREVPDLLKPAYLFGGLSLSQMAEPYVNNWLRARQSVSDLLNAFSVMVLMTNMSGTMAGDFGTDLFARVDAFSRFRNNRGTFVLDKETEELQNVSAPLGGLDALLSKAQEQMASVYGIPNVIFFGIQPQGLNASSDSEIRVFYDFEHGMQEHIVRPPLAKIIDMIQISEFGSIDPTITFDFVPLWEQTEVERSTIRKTRADTAAVYIADGVLDPAEERARLAAEEDGDYDGLDLSVMPEPPEEDLEPKIGPGEKEDGDPDEPK